jgi:manganese oxidase
VVVNQAGIQLRDRNDNPICPIEGKADEEGGTITTCRGADDAEETGNVAVNYRSEPMWFRLGFDPGAPLTQTRNVDMTNAVSNSQIGGDPATPVFIAKAGTPVRIRLGEHAGHTRNGVFNLHGHIWQREPYLAGAVPSQTIGNNPLSEYRTMQEGLGTGNHFDIVLQNGAGGAFRIPGDYLLRDQASFILDGGRWGLLRVQK